MKKFFYALLGVLIIGGLAFALSNTNLFKGALEPVIEPECIDFYWEDLDGTPHHDEICDDPLAVATFEEGLPEGYEFITEEEYEARLGEIDLDEIDLIIDGGAPVSSEFVLRLKVKNKAGQFIGGLDESNFTFTDTPEIIGEYEVGQYSGYTFEGEVISQKVYKFVFPYSFDFTLEVHDIDGYIDQTLPDVYEPLEDFVDVEPSLILSDHGYTITVNEVDGAGITDANVSIPSEGPDGLDCIHLTHGSIGRDGVYGCNAGIRPDLIYYSVDHDDVTYHTSERRPLITNQFDTSRNTHDDPQVTDEVTLYQVGLDSDGGGVDDFQETIDGTDPLNDADDLKYAYIRAKITDEAGRKIGGLSKENFQAFSDEEELIPATVVEATEDIEDYILAIKYDPATYFEEHSDLFYYIKVIDNEGFVNTRSEYSMLSNRELGIYIGETIKMDHSHIVRVFSGAEGYIDYASVIILDDIANIPCHYLPLYEQDGSYGCAQPLSTIGDTITYQANTFGHLSTQEADHPEIRTAHSDPAVIVSISINMDSDGDGLADNEETYLHLTLPDNPDTDGDGLSDGDEVLVYGSDPLLPDTDGDTLTDGNEVNVHGTSPTEADTDFGTIDDGTEVNRGSDPLDPDDDLPEDPGGPLEPIDTDGDGLTDDDEINIHGTDPLLDDTDGDDLLDGAEVNTYGTDPRLPDTDEDGLNDGEEVNTHFTDPLDADTDNDTLLDGAEVNTHETDPLLADTDGGTVDDGTEVNINLTDPLDPLDDVRSEPEEPTYACTSLDLSPDDFRVLERDNGTIEILLDIELEVEEIEDEVALPNWFRQIFAFSQVFLSEEPAIDWLGTLKLETTGTGTFPNGETSYELEVNSEEEIQVIYSGASIDDIITASIIGEETDCTDTLNIQEEKPVPNPETDNDNNKTDFTCHSDPFIDTRGAFGEELWYTDPACIGWELGVVEGKTAYLFDPVTNVTRAEYLAMLLRAAGVYASEGYYIDTNFADMPDEHWARDYFAIAYARGVIHAEEFGFVNPDLPATRSDMLVWFARLYNFTLYDFEIRQYCSDINQYDPYAYAFALAAQWDVEMPTGHMTTILTGNPDGTCSPSGYMNRAEAVTFTLRVLAGAGRLDL
ncbi:S-layer homology domain-containing protein [Candidatus Peregrinibacteria bacterium]|jgi:hypothetical protein|nr:S-layer homology domain-containing protein [Candidatus Peregrinibacteria bacterium]MBT4632133.1 S-layer homology domain-containing protein [Candidatus Peregrinibacteria bacterium]MBT5824051.1 S-layer homology domain-containing protein [Candidatus Peregrinibacteria bacterium]